jgi:hypothetical protein
MDLEIPLEPVDIKEKIRENPFRVEEDYLRQ